MNTKTTQKFLIITIIFLLVSLTAANAAEDNKTDTQKNQHTITKTSAQLSTQAAEEETIKSVKTRNTKTSNEKTNTTLDINFIPDEEDEFSTDEYLITHKYQHYTIDITLTEEKTGTPISDTIQLYLLDETTPIPITIPTSGHTQTTQTIDRIGEMMTVYAQYEGNDQYNQSTSKTLRVDSEQYETTLTLNKIDSQQVNSTVTVSGQLTYDDNTAISDATIIIKVNDNIETTTKTNNEGQYSKSIKLENIKAQEGAHLTVEFNSDDDKYEDSGAEDYFDIEKIENIITLNPISNPSTATPIEISGTVTNNINIYNKDITIKIKNATDTVYANNSVKLMNGQYNITFTPEMPSHYNITIETSEDDYYNSQIIQDSIEVQKASVYLELEDSYSSTVQENVSITGKAMNEYDYPLSNVLITISTTDGTIGSVITDDEGKFNFTQYRFESVIEDEFNNIFFEVEENDVYDAFYDYATIYVTHRNVKITMEAEEHTKINQALHLKVKVTDAYNSSLTPGGSVLIKINDTIVYSILEGSDGNYTTEIPVLEEYVSHDEMRIYAYFQPDDLEIYYSDSYENITSIVDATSTHIEVLSNDTLVKNPANITVILEDEFNRRLNKSVTLYVRNESNNIVYSGLLELKNGTATVTFTPVNAGKYYIIAQYDGIEHIYTLSAGEYEIIAQKNAAEIILNPVNQIQFVNDSITVSGLLQDGSGNPLDDITLRVEIINATVTSQTTAVTRNGIFTTSFRKTNTDNIILRIILDETDEYSECYAECSFQIVKHNTTVNINRLNSEINYTDIILLSGNVVDSDSHKAVNGSVEIRINNQTVKVVELEGGNYELPLSVTVTGKDNNITVIFIENDAYNTSISNVKFNVSPLQSRIVINRIDDAIINDTIRITGTLKDQKNNNISGQLTVKINDETGFQSIQVNNGSYNFIITPEKVGIYTINISYNADNQHYLSTSTVTTFKVLKADIEIENADAQVDARNKTITITADITSQANISTSNIPVRVIIADKEYNKTTNSSGGITIETQKLLPGMYNATLIVDNTSYTNTQSTIIENIKISKDNVNIHLDEITGMSYSENYTIHGKLTDDYERGLNSTEVTITIRNTTYNVTTDDEGNFNKTLIHIPAGTNNITIRIEQSETHNEKTLITSFLVEKGNAKILLEENTRVLPQDDFTIRGTLTDNHDNPLENQAITIMINNRKYTTKTNANGKFNITSKKAKLGTYNITATFTSSNYNTAKINKTIRVTKLNVNVAVSDIISVVGENITLRATVTDELGQKVSGGNLVFKLNGRSLRKDDRFDTNIPGVHKFMVKDGIVEYTISADLYLRKGKNISASYSGSFLYESAKSNTATASIKLRNAAINVTTKTSAKLHENITFTARLSDKTAHTNQSLVNDDAYVIFKVNDITLKDKSGNVIRVAVVNSTAQYTYDIGVKSATDKDFNKINYKVTAIYDSPHYYPDARNTTIFNVEKSAVNINITQAKVNDTSLHLKANLTDYLGCNVEGNSKVCVKINAVTYKEHNVTKYYTVTDGVLDIRDIDITGIKVKNVEIVTGERQAYLGARKTTNKIEVVD